MASNISSKTYLDYAGLTYLVQNHIIDKKIGTTVGDMLYVSAVNNNIPTYGRIGVPTSPPASGTDNYVMWCALNSGGTLSGPVWTNFSGLLGAMELMTDPMTAEGDIIYALNSTIPQSSKKAPGRLGLGSTGQVLIARNETNVKQPEWKTIAWLFGTYNASSNPYTDAAYNSNSSGKLCLNLPDIQSIPTTGANSIDSLFS